MLEQKEDKKMWLSNKNDDIIQMRSRECRGRESNPQALNGHYILSVAWLPISSPRRQQLV